MDLFAWLILVLLVAKSGVQLWLEAMNRGHVLAHANAVPPAFRGVVDDATYAKSVDYTLTRGRFHQIETVWDAVILGLVLFTGVLPTAYELVVSGVGSSAWALAGFVFLTGLAFSLTGLPLSWYGQFRLEQRFGFNTSTQATWWTDRLKGLLLSLLLVYPLVVLLLKLVDWTGEWWWVYAWAALTGFQLLMAVVAPVLILPLFNKFTPLPEGPLKDRLLALAAKTRFKARSIQVMDGSRRSRHSNAFFTGFGSLRKIVLFDTLLQQLEPAELEAVLAHEIGHFKKKHIPKMLAVSTVGSLGGFYVLSVLAKQHWLNTSFGFPAGLMVATLLLFGLLAGLFTFWLSPLTHRWSRKFEYEADAYAREAMQGPEPLIGALRKLNEKNLSNLTPHPAYSRFYYSHPTLIERERALTAGSLKPGGLTAVPA